jgi:HEAT repeat protein
MVPAVFKRSTMDDNGRFAMLLPMKSKTISRPRSRWILGALLLGGLAMTLCFNFLGKTELAAQGKSISGWVIDLNSPDAGARERAARVIESIGSAGVPFLIEALETKDPQWKRALIHFTRKLPNRVQPALFRMIRPEKEYKIRLGAADALGRLGTQGAKAAPALGRVMREDDLMISWKASRALGRMGAAGVPELVATLVDGRVSLFDRVFAALCEIGSEAEAAIPILIESLSHPATNTAMMAARTLGAIGPAAVSSLVQSTKGPDVRKRRFAVFALGRVGLRARPAVSDLIALVFDADSLVRQNSVEALGKINPTSSAVVTALTAALMDPSKDVQWQAIEALSRSPRTAGPATDVLQNVMLGDDQELRERAGRLLEELQRMRAPADPAPSDRREGRVFPRTKLSLLA